VLLGKRIQHRCVPPIRKRRQVQLKPREIPRRVQLKPREIPEALPFERRHRHELLTVRYVVFRGSPPSV
jgi:hypothetical protein